MAPYNPLKQTPRHDPLWYLDYYDAPPPRTGIQDLPNELLANVAQFSANSDLCQLSLVNKRLREVAQSALVRHVKMPHHGIRKFVEAMATRPDLASLIGTVDLGDFGCEEHAVELGECALEAMKNIEGVVTKFTSPEQWDKLVIAKDGPEDVHYGHGSSFYLAVLSIIATNWRVLAVEPRPLGNYSPAQLVDTSLREFWVLQNLSPLFNGPLSGLLQNKLESLTVSTASSCFKGNHMQLLSFTNFQKLKHLRVPMKALVLQDRDTTEPEGVLPQNLEWMEIQSCNRLAYDWISKLFHALERKELPKLRRLHLYFDDSLPASLVLMCHGDHARISTLNLLLTEMESKYQCKITVFTRKSPQSGYVSEDLSLELESYLQIPPSEAWFAAAKGDTFTAALARNNEGKPRPRLKFERKMFFRNQQIMTTLFTSRTFDPTAWKDVRFMKGIKYTKTEFEKKNTVHEKGVRSPRSPSHQDKRRGAAKLRDPISDLVI